MSKHQAVFRRSAMAFVLASGAAVWASSAFAHGGSAAERLDATQAAAAVCKGQVRSVTLVRAALEHAKQHADLNAFVSLDEAGALAAAQAADAARAAGKPCLPLQGVPIVIKDNLNVAGIAGVGATPALRDFKPAADAPVVAKLRAAGAVIIGKTNMHELAFGISGYNTAFKTGSQPGVRNAYDPSKMAGGSSSGTAAAIGARIVPAGLGTDTGGSVRIPCALNGCASLRPTVGRYSQEGIVPISHTRDTAGPMARSMADVELIDRVITGAARMRPASLRAVRLGVVPEFIADLDDDTRAATEAALARLRKAGVRIIDVQMPKVMELNGAVGFPVAVHEAYDDLAAYLKTNNVDEVAKGIGSPDVKGVFDAMVMPRKLIPPGGQPVDSAPAYKAALETSRPALVKLYADTFAANRLDGIVFPTVPRVALDATPEASSPQNFGLFIRNTDPGSNAGVPGVNVPVALGKASRLPIAIEIDGPAGSDRRLLAIGMAIEQLVGRLPAPR
ncbi:MAG TPA: indoleacetamide hydrolase [Burkholderiaceae bacterium]|nr:indoleacetamide hydrolase [Burkholderiaceae bacterium]